MRLLLEGIAKIDNINDAQDIVQKRATYGSTWIKQYLLPTRLQRQWLLMASRESGLNMTNQGNYDLIDDIGMVKDGSTGIEYNPDWGDVYKNVISFIAQSGTYFTPTLQVRYGDVLTREYSTYLYWHQPNSKLTQFTPDDVMRGILTARPIDTVNSGLIYPALVNAEIRHLGVKASPKTVAI